MKVSIIGSGVAGSATGIGLVQHGNDVIFYDISSNKLIELGEKGYKTTEDISSAVSSADIIILCVPTPTTNGEMNFQYMENATINVAKQLKKENGYKVIVIKSTVLPSTTRTKVIPLLEKHSKLKAGKDFGVCMNPEFLREKKALEDFLNPDRIVIGELDRPSGNALEQLYESFKTKIIRTNLDTAEMIKYVANTFLATKISFFNEVYLLCRALELDSTIISKAVAMDPRIGEYGVYGGRSFEGGCLPKDLEAFISFARDNKFVPALLETTLEINNTLRKMK